MSTDLPADLRCVAIERRNSVDFVARVLSAYGSGQVVVPFDDQPPAELRRFISGDPVETRPGGGWFRERVTPRVDPAPAHINLTSGTTGEPKPILLSHRALSDVTIRLSEIMRIDDSIREYVGVPVTLSFGLARVRAVAANGGATFIPESGFRVDEFAGMLARGEVNALSAVPTLLRLVLAQRERFADAADKLRWIEIGSQPMSAVEKDELRQLFPNARIVQHYGLTEASRSTFLVVSEASAEELASVGSPTGSVEVRITDEGRIGIRGPHLADGILTAEGLTPIVDADGWLVTQDLGHLTGDTLFFNARADDLINVGGLKVPADLFEGKLRGRLPTGASVGVAAGEDPLRGQIVIVAHELGDSSPMLAAIDEAASETARELGIGGAYALQAMPAIPRTETGKVRRFLISEQFDSSELGEAPVESAPDAAASPGAVHQAFLDMFGARAADGSASFQSLGGDSLNYVTMLTALERHIPALPDDWDRTSIDSLECLGSAEAAAAENAVEKAFADVFGADRIEEGASFYSLGGDSLNYVQMLTALERVIPNLPEDWASESIAGLSGLAAERGARAEPSLRRFIPRNLDTVRGLACTLVVALHVVGTKASSGLRLPMSSPWHFTMDTLDLIRMPLFTAMAGFLYAAMPAGEDGAWPFMRRKFGQLLVPLLFATLAYWGLQKVLFTVDRSLLAAYLYGYRHLWYLESLLTMFALVSFADVRLGRSVAIWTAILAGVVLAGAVIPYIRFLHFFATLALLPSFILGMLLYRAPPILRSWPLLLFAALAMAVVIGVRVFDPHLFFTAPAALTLICGCASVLFFLRVFPRVPLLERIAPYSFTIYLWHPAANMVARTVLSKLGLHDIPVRFCVGMVAAITLPILLHLVMIRLPRFLSAPVIAR